MSITKQETLSIYMCRGEEFSEGDLVQLSDELRWIVKQEADADGITLFFIKQE